MPNESMTFKFQGRTYGMEDLFAASEVRNEKYFAFGKEMSFLHKLVKLGFVVEYDVVYHPDHWRPIDDGAGQSFFTHSFVSSSGKVHLGRVKKLSRR